MNRLLLENSNKSTEETSEASNKELVPNWNLDGSIIAWETPQKSKDIRQQAREITRLKDIDSSTCKILFRKVAKSLDDKDFVIAKHELRIKQLEARVEELKPKKRRKVRTSPNSKFAGIKAIRRAQIEAGNSEIKAEDFDISIDSVSTLSCIELEE